MTKAYDKIAEGLREALAGKAKTARFPRHSRFLGWSHIRATLKHVRAAGAYGPAFFRGPRLFWPLAEQLAFRRKREECRRLTGYSRRKLQAGA